jgi:hypothetical protein
VLRHRSAPLARQEGSCPPCRWRRGLGESRPRARSCSRGSHFSKTDSIGAPPRETACGRGKREGSATRDARTLRRSDSSSAVFTGGRGRADSIDEGGGLVAAPWERRRTRRGPGVANGRVEHPTRAAPAGGRERAADATSMTGPIRRAGPRASRHGARRSNGARRPVTRANRKGSASGEGASTSPLVHVRIVVRRSLVLGTTPGASFAGARGSEGEPLCSARRAPAGASHPRRGVHDVGRRQTVQSRHRRSPPPGGRSRGRRPGTRGSASRPLTGACDRGLTTAPVGAARRKSAHRREVWGPSVSEDRRIRAGSPSLDEARRSAWPLTARRCRHAARELIHPKSPA